VRGAEGRAEGCAEGRAELRLRPRGEGRGRRGLQGEGGEEEGCKMIGCP